MKSTDLKLTASRISHSGLFWVLLLSFTFRNIYHHFMSGIFYNFDTTSYTYAAENILSGKIDIFRTPGYPVLLRLVQMVDEMQYFENVLLVQHILSFLSIIPFYLTCKKWINNGVLATLAALAFGCMPSILQYNYSVFPESILISFTALFLFLISRFISNPSVKYITILSFVLFILVMIKPVGIIYYALTILVAGWIFIFNSNKKLLIHSTIAIGTSVLMVLGYAGLNYSQNGYFGISSVTHDNNFLNVLHSGAYTTVEDDTFVAAIDTSLYKGKYYTIYCLNNDHDFIQNQAKSFPKFYPVTSHINAVKRIPANSLGYNRKNVAPLIQEAMSSEIFWNYMWSKIGYFSERVFYRLTGLWYYFLLGVSGILLVINFWIKKKISTDRLFIFVSVTGMIFITVIGGVDDGTWERVFLPVVPFAILLFTGVVDDMLNMILSKKEK